MSDNNSGSGFLAGVILGSTIGFLMGILLAPASGEQTRKVIKEKTGEMSEEVKVKTMELMEKVKEAVKKGVDIKIETSDELH